jgi:hypothetical protein
MKKYIISGIAVLAIAAVAAWNVSMNTQNNSRFTNLSLANVELLANGESGASCTVTTNCSHGSVSCTSPNNNCSRDVYGVTCDGVTTYC